ncbi:MAG: hypothetical protein A2Y54_03520 [Chloroflexi bacterium RBG_16_51_16]|nr:MAG: hypothetical protein A2Y54_03520 [Chloroflexi bacterium RBG_16_51_16]
MDFIQIFLRLGLVIQVFMLLVWLCSLALKDSSIVDIFWGPGFVLTNWVAFGLTPEGYFARKSLLSVLVTIWGLRLGLHILVRNLGKPEDFRYQAMRIEGGKTWWWISYFKVFVLQGFLMWLIAAPLLAAQIHSEPQHLTWIDAGAVVIWVIGFFFEAAGDWQLMHFKADPSNKGRVLNTGVWRYTRHPNYFGDAVQWWGFYFLAVSAGGWFTLFSPMLMTGLLLRVSGVTLLEKTLKATKPEYQRYINSTSPFLPWFPKERRVR